MARFRVEKSVCGCTVRTGSMIIGWWNIISSVLVLLACIFILCAYDFENETKKNAGEIKLSKGEMIAYAVYALIDLIFGVLLVIGVRQKRASLLRTWMYYIAVCLVVFIIFQIFKGITLMLNNLVPAGVFEIFQGFSGSLITLYMVMIVNSHYHEILEEQPQGGPSSYRV